MGKRKAINILFNIREFLKSEAKRKDFSIIHFAAATSNKFNVISLYKKLAPEAINGISDCHVRFAVPLDKSSEQKAQNLIDGFQLIYRNLLNDVESDRPPISGFEFFN